MTSYTYIDDVIMPSHDVIMTSYMPTHLEELLVEDEGHATDLLHSRLVPGVVVGEVGGDGQGQLPTQLLPARGRSARLQLWQAQVGNLHYPLIISIVSRDLRSKCNIS